MAQSLTLNKNHTQNHSRWWHKLLRQSIFYIVLILLWHLLAQSGILPSYAIAGPLDVWQSLIAGFQNGSFITAILTSTRHLVVGYLLSLILGLALGLLIGLNRYVKETLGSLVLGLQALPSVCWVPLAILWFHLGDGSITFVVIMGALFSITLGVEAGVKNTPPVYIKAARNMGSTGLHLALRVVLPAALPSIIAGLKQGWTFAWRSLMAAEIISVTLTLGGLLETSNSLNDVGTMFAVMIIIIMVGVIIDSVFFKPLEQAIRTRWGFDPS